MARPPSDREPAHLTFEQKMARAIAMHDARCSLLQQGWDLESVLDTKWTVEFQSDGTCTAELVTSASALPTPSSGQEGPLDADLGQSTYDWQGPAGALQLEVTLSRAALARLVAGKEVLLTRARTANRGGEVIGVMVSPRQE
jgi:hypothetical protein